MTKTLAFYSGTHGFYHMLDPNHFEVWLSDEGRFPTPTVVEVYRSRNPNLVRRVDEDGAPAEPTSAQ